MNLDYLDFEQPIVELEAKISELQSLTADNTLNISDEVKKLRQKSRSLTSQVFGDLSPWQIVQLARHPLRPYTMDYINLLCDDFESLHGDRHFADDHALVAGTARLDGMPVMIIGHQKGRSTKDKVHHNFGMAKPEGYRKALRLMRLAERFGLPILTFVDTPGAYPGIGAEERSQSEAIARNLYEMIDIKVPIICTVIGEGGSGGALAIAIADHIMMLQYAVYATISPEGCASILWRRADMASEAAQAMGVTAQHSLDLQLIDEVIPEPLGGAHRNPQKMAARLKRRLKQQIVRVQDLGTDTMLEQRYQKFMAIGEQ